MLAVLKFTGCVFSGNKPVSAGQNNARDQIALILQEKRPGTSKIAISSTNS